jgi:hypothetical protein
VCVAAVLWDTQRDRSVVRRCTRIQRVFVFLERRKNQVKLILWTRGGFTIVHERLERCGFRKF